MAIQNVNISTDLVQDLANKFNNNNQYFVTNGNTSGQNLILNRNGAGNITIPLSFIDLWKTGVTTSLQPNRSDGNVNSGNYSTIGGGSNNKLLGSNSFIGAGKLNTAMTQYSFIGGGQNNITNNNLTFIGGGEFNSVTGNYSSIVGGVNNQISNAQHCFIGGGRKNNVNSYYCLIGTGNQNLITGSSSFSSILNGNNNLINNSSNTAIVGGSNITATTSNSVYVPALYIDQGGINFSSAHTANQNFGSITLTSGTAVVSSTGVKANSLIYVSANEGTMTGVLQITTRSAGTSFTITSSVLTDTEKVSWLIINPY